jgi:ABC-type uncharacterized transport system ATPase subunit
VVVIHNGRVVLAGEVEAIRAASPRRYLDAVVAGSGGHWVDGIGAEVVRREGDRVRLALDIRTDVAALAAVAAAAGQVVEFSFSPPDLSEVFREAVTR